MPVRRTISFALVLGVLMTTLLAWLAMFLPTGNAWDGPAATTDLGLWREQGDAATWQISRGDNAWHSVVTYWHMQISGMSVWMPADDYERQKYDYKRLPAHLRPNSLSELRTSASFHETGWPFRALAVHVQWKRQVSNADIIYDVFGGYQLPRDAQFNPRALPLRPIWPGLLANVLIFTCLWLLVFWLLHHVRAQRRQRKHRCLQCGYPRTGLPADAQCPECGSSPKQSAIIT